MKNLEIALQTSNGIRSLALEAVKELELYLQMSPNTKEADQIKNLIKELNKKAGKS